MCVCLESEVERKLHFGTNFGVSSGQFLKGSYSSGELENCGFCLVVESLHREGMLPAKLPCLVSFVSLVFSIQYDSVHRKTSSVV